MSEIDTSRVHYLTISAEDDGQRVDNFIRKRYPNLPKSRIYQMLRKGEARLNKKRLKPTSRIAAGDQLRLPPIPEGERVAQWIPPQWQKTVAESVLYEDDNFLILNKPAGLPVHGGSAQQYGMIDIVRAEWGEHYAELAHRLDRDTSGCLVLGKHRQALSAFQQLMNDGAVEKRYWALVRGQWDAHCTEVTLQLHKEAEKIVVREGGKTAKTYFHISREFSEMTLIEAMLETGRTHQIRVTTSHLNHPIAGDDKYGDWSFNQSICERGYRGMFLHARSIRFTYQDTLIHVQAALPQAAKDLLEQLEKKS
ncbi:RluA family pseudouridine synthase [Suttonella sp. R2A3]|uniref:RluA family pseudouridine synthase n=1 Tax=Suttonella sp. R2A3 TaxID=2908648 RepID=UPI001F1708B8|nr:RluA family pseudouridine synthase [Suttonella sp. R2A3]UJF24889.1 RluA family pseudouridine synthase [Suttonella sp. R2A3]